MLRFWMEINAADQYSDTIARIWIFAPGQAQAGVGSPKIRIPRNDSIPQIFGTIMLCSLSNDIRGTIFMPRYMKGSFSFEDKAGTHRANVDLLCACKH